MSKSFNIPLYKINPANQIIDMINGKSTICIANPYFGLPGIGPIDINTFLTIKPIVKTAPNGTTTGTSFSVSSPFVVVNLQHIYPDEYKDAYFTRNVLFTQDAGEKQPTTKLTFYADFQGNNSQASKALGKYTAKRGVFADGDGVHRELIINYQLTQAFEFLYLARMLKISRFDFNTDADFLTYITSVIYLGQPSQFSQIPPDVAKPLADYINYNLLSLKFPDDIVKDPFFVKTNDHRFMTKFSKTLDSDGSYFKLYNYDIISLLKTKLSTIRPTTVPAYIDASYLDIIRNIHYEGMKSATANCAYSVKDAKSPNGVKYGTTIKTDYTLVLIGEGNHTKKLQISPKTNKPEFVNMQLSDMDSLKNVPHIAKVFLELSFDMRAYPSLSNSPFSIRYKINSIVYKKSNFSKGLNVSTADIDISGFTDVDADATDVDAVQNDIDPSESVF